MAIYKDMSGYRQLFDEEYKRTRELISQGETHLDNLAEGFLEADQVIRKMPVADVVEVVRCKDCKHWGGVTYGFVCRKFSGIETKICMGAEHFCSYGERKDQE